MPDYVDLDGQEHTMPDVEDVDLGGPKEVRTGLDDFLNALQERATTLRWRPRSHLFSSWDRLEADFAWRGKPYTVTVVGSSTWAVRLIVRASSRPAVKIAARSSEFSGSVREHLADEIVLSVLQMDALDAQVTREEAMFGRSRM